MFRLTGRVPMSCHPPGHPAVPSPSQVGRPGQRFRQTTVRPGRLARQQACRDGFLQERVPKNQRIPVGLQDVGLHGLAQSGFEALVPHVH